jgi:peptide/nickel transport system ATP-binding protein
LTQTAGSPVASDRPKADPILSVRSLQVAFVGSGRPVPAVRGVSFDVYPNEVLGIVGESGSGKSVTSLAVAGLLPATAEVRGSIVLNGTEVTSADSETMRRVRAEQVGFIFQDPTTTLNPVLPVGRQITEGQVANGRLPPGQARHRAVELLREVEVADPAGRAGQYPHQFSGGMRQRAVIAMAMAGRPNLIIADEPTTALDVTVQAQVLALLGRRQAETGAAVILITHDLGVIAEVAHRVAVMYGGRIVETGPVDEIFNAPRHPYTVALLQSIPRIDAREARLDPIPGQPPTPTNLPSGCPFQPRCPIGRENVICAEQDPPLRPVGGTQEAACHFAGDVAAGVLAGRLPAAAPAPQIPARRHEAPLLVVDSLQVHFPVRTGLLRRTSGHVRAVDGVSLTLDAGETLSLVGESGCGKTTTVMQLLELASPEEGRVSVLGRDVASLGRDDRKHLRREVQVVFQDPVASLDPRLPVSDLIGEPLRAFGVARDRRHRRVRDLLDLVGLNPELANRYPADLSGGQRQRIGIARALALEPRLLVLDEPVSALDVSIQAGVLNLLEHLKVHLGLAYLFVGHDLSVVRHVADRVAVMYLGRLVEVGDADEVFGHPTHPYTQALLSAVPIPEPATERQRTRILLPGDLPSPVSLPSGCRFRSRCPLFARLPPERRQRCRDADPLLEPRSTGDHMSACHWAREREVLPGSTGPASPKAIDA